MLVLAGGASVGTLIGAGSTLKTVSADISGEAISGCSVVDGDTLRCQGERIRLLGIDAPEFPGHCRPGRDCAPGDPYASTKSLEQALSGQLTVVRVGEDQYGRTLAMINGTKGNLSCWQLQQRHAVYKPQWDNGFRVARACPRIIAQ